MSTPSLSTRVFRHPDGALPNLLAFAYLLAAYAGGLGLMAAGSWPAALAGTLWFAHGLIVAAYLFHEFAQVFGMDVSESKLYETLYQKALMGNADGGGLLAFNYVSGEHITHLEAGRPMFIRTPESRFTLANFMRTHLFSSLGALKIGMDILFDQEHVKIDQLLGHGGFFKTKEVGQRIMAAAMNVPVSVMETAGEGGAWGIALLASYMLHKSTNEPLEAYLADKVFAAENGTTIAPDPRDVDGFAAFMARYTKGLVIERTAVDAMK